MVTLSHPSYSEKVNLEGHLQWNHSVSKGTYSLLDTYSIGDMTILKTKNTQLA